jgi:membrane protein YdbS with pleckstrin-like domain
MNHCTNCGERMTPSARFCPGCGAPADTELTRLSSGQARPAFEEETRVAPQPRPWTGGAPRPVRPLQHDAPPARRRDADEGEVEKVIFKVRPTLLFIKVGYALAALVSVLVFGLLAWFQVPAPLAVPLALLTLLVPAYKHFRRNTFTYTLTDAKIEIEQGFFSRTTRHIPLRNIQDVTITATLSQRLLRFGDVVVDNAGAVGGTTVLDNIPDPRRHADLILRELRRWR